MIKAYRGIQERPQALVKAPLGPQKTNGVTDTGDTGLSWQVIQPGSVLGVPPYWKYGASKGRALLAFLMFLLL